MGELGTFVRERRKALGYTLEEVADQIGVSHQALSQLELGQTRGLKGPNMYKLARVLNVTADALLEKQMQSHPTPPALKEAAAVG
jgi:transcriptional regulator with XRE-family HTH domain